MNLHVPRAVHMPLLALGACAFVAALAVASAEPFAAWLESANREAARTSVEPMASADGAAEPTPAPDGRRAKCAECGFIESARPAEGGRLYEITVRLADRSRHVFKDTDAAKWRPGQRIILIGSAVPAER